MHRQTSRLRWIHFTVKLWNGQSICSLPWQYIVSLDIHFVTLMNGFSSKHQLFTFFNSLPVSFLHSLLTFNADYVSSMYFYNEFIFSWMFSHQTLCLVYRRRQVQRQRDEKLYVITCHNENMFEWQSPRCWQYVDGSGKERQERLKLTSLTSTHHTHTKKEDYAMIRTYD